MFDLRIMDLSKTEEEESYVDFISLTNEQWAMIKTNIELLKNHKKCEFMSNEELKATIQDIHDNVYQQGYEKGGKDMEEAKQFVIDSLLKEIETLEADGAEIHRKANKYGPHNKNKQCRLDVGS